MPIYEYECQKCGQRIEAMQKMSDPPLNRHKNCGGKLSRLLSPPALQFKGTGWYVTDYGRKGNGNKSSESGASESKPESKTEAKAESKSESKAAPKTD